LHVFIEIPVMTSEGIASAPVGTEL